MIEGGTWAAVKELESATAIPPAGAAPLNVTVAAEGLPPMTKAGKRTMPVGWGKGGGLTVKEALFVVPPLDAEIVTPVPDATEVVDIAKVPLVAPAGIVKLGGTVAAALLLASAMAAPSGGAGPVRVTVPTAPAPPVTLAGLRVTLAGVNGLIVSAPDALDAPSVPLIVAAVPAATRCVETVKVAVVAPAGIVTLVGTVAAEEVLVNVTTLPPAGAFPFNVTVAVAPVPAMTVAGARVTLATANGLTVTVAVFAVLLAVAVTVTEVAAETAFVVTAKVPVVLPAGIVKLAGTVAAEVFELERVTTSPPAGAAPLNVIVPIAEIPPATEAGANVNEAGTITAGVRVRMALFVTPPHTAEIVLPWELATAVVVTEKLAEICPAGTVTERGTWAAANELVSVTTIPPVGAAPASVTVPVEETPPTTDVGERVTPVKAGGVTVRELLFVTPPVEVEIETVVAATTGFVVMANVPLVLPAGIVTLAGTVAAETLLLASTTAAPSDGAGPVRVTVPVTAVPPVTVARESVRLAGTKGLTVSVPDALDAPSVPLIVATVATATKCVETVKVSVAVPTGIVTLAGNVAAGDVLVNVTTLPPAGAFPFNVTVPVTLVPARTVAGARVTLATANGLTVNVAVFEPPLTLAVIVTEVAAETTFVVAAKVPAVLPAATVKLAGTVATEVFELERVTTVPPAGATALNVTVPDETAPPATAAGFNPTPVTVTAAWSLPAKPISAKKNSAKVVIFFAALDSCSNRCRTLQNKSATFNSIVAMAKILHTLRCPGSEDATFNGTRATLRRSWSPTRKT